MSKINDGSVTIYEAMQNIKNDKYVMPAFQRQFVWGMGQIERLWDSILLDYPVANFLFWKIDEKNITKDTQFCSFLQDVTFDSRKQSDSVNYKLSGVDLNISDTAILDGQQRLTSLYLSLFGTSFIRPSHARKKTGERILSSLLIELNENKVDIDADEYNCKHYDIRFTEKIYKASPTQFKIKSILEDKYRNESTREIAIEKAIEFVPDNSKTYARNILVKLCSKIYDEKLIRYTEIVDMMQDDALEMFVRFNSGGKPLRKSEITMSILEAYWPSAKSEFGKILSGQYRDFGTDFIVRLALMLYGDVVKSNINMRIAEELKGNWTEFQNALNNTADLLKELKIDITRFSSSWNVLLPIIYSVYYNPDDYQESITAFKVYLMRALLFTYFQSGTTAKLQQMKNNIKDFDNYITIEMLDQITDLMVSDGKIEDILNAEKGSRVVGEVLYYMGLDWIKPYYKYEQDHLHPYEGFEFKPANVSHEELKAWRSLRNRLPNLQLLEGHTNGIKNDMRLIDYYNDMNEQQRKQFREQAMIPDGESLEFSNFMNFYNSRKELLRNKIKGLLS